MCLTKTHDLFFTLFSELVTAWKSLRKIIHNFWRKKTGRGGQGFPWSKNWRGQLSSSRMGGLSLDQDDQMRTRTEVAVKNWNEKYSSQSRVVIAGSIREVGDSGRIPPQLV